MLQSVPQNPDMQLQLQAYEGGAGACNEGCQIAQVLWPRDAEVEGVEPAVMEKEADIVDPLLSVLMAADEGDRLTLLK
ncbi:unnamed protein product [Closterium sp. NIES-53]